MNEYLAIMHPLLSWITSGLTVLAALAFVWTTITAWADRPDDLDLMPLLARMVGYAILVILGRNTAAIVASLANTPGAAPTVESMARPVLSWIIDGLAVLGAALAIWVVLRSWMDDPGRYHWLRAVATMLGVGITVVVLRASESIMRTLAS